jgi:hypothetical protein
MQKPRIVRIMIRDRPNNFEVPLANKQPLFAPKDQAHPKLAEASTPVNNSTTSIVEKKIV